MGSGPIGILAMSPTHHFTTDYGIPVSDVDDIIYSRTGFPMESGIPLRTCEQYRISQSPQSEPSLRRPPHEDPGLRPSSQSNSRREYAKPLRPRRLHGPQASRSESRSGRSPDSAYGSFVPTGPSTPASYVSDPVDKIATLLPRCESISASELLERCLQLGDGLQTHTASFSCGAENETCPSREIPAWDWAFNSLDDHAGVPGSHSCPASQSASLDYRTIGHEEELVREPRQRTITVPSLQRRAAGVGATQLERPHSGLSQYTTGLEAADMAMQGHRDLVEATDMQYADPERVAESPACTSPDDDIELSVVEGAMDSSYYGEEYQEDTVQESQTGEFAEPSDGHEVPAGATSEASSSPSGKVVLRSDFSANAGQGKRKGGPNGRRDQDDEDDGGFKRPRPNVVSSPAVSMQSPTRFACPYQKSDPKACEKCGMGSRNGKEPGFRDFHRVVDHVRKDHNPFISCHTCWRTYKTNDEATEHYKKGGCGPKQRPYPEGFWITAEIFEKLTPTKHADGKRVGSMFKLSPSENWYALFDMLRPDLVERIGQKEIRSQFLPWYGDCIAATPSSSYPTPQSNSSSASRNWDPRSPVSTRSQSEFPSSPHSISQTTSFAEFPGATGQYTPIPPAIDFHLDPYVGNSAVMFSNYETAFGSSPAQQIGPVTVPETPGFLAAPPNAIRAQDEKPATKSMLREQLEKLREKRAYTCDQILIITSALRGVLQEDTPEGRRERLETCIDMLQQLRD